jgi:hypothetical protein
MYFSFSWYCQRQVLADALGRKEFVPSAGVIFVAVISWRPMMRTLKTEEMELVAGGVPEGVPAGDNSQSTKNNGWGNGDQGPPGQSGPHNQAENEGGA